VNRARSEFARFCGVGGVGFLVDAGLTLLLTAVAGMPPWLARIPAFLVAATVTWLLHQRFTFGKRQPAGSWLLYVLLTTFGALVNLSIYLLWLKIAGSATPLHVVLGVAAGSTVALAFNFVMSRRWVFN
jgi:putative flippase GtrA